MAFSILLRKNFGSSMTMKRSLSAIAFSLFKNTISPIYTVSGPINVADVVNQGNGVVSKRGSSSKLGFTASFSSYATGVAVADDPGYVSAEEGLDISKLGVHEDIISCLSSRGITKLFPIQKAVLEPAMQGRDMIGRARTGTGKTLAFGIPMLDKITRFNAQHGAGKEPLALVLAPTRELAKQVEKEFHESSKLETLCVYGGTPIYSQMSVLNSGVDVVAGTPGRVIDLIKRGALDLSQVKFLVLDEADQMLNVGFVEHVETIMEKLPKNRQTLLFSATMPSWIVKLTEKYLKNPVTIDLVGDSSQKLAEGISLHSLVVDHRIKAGVVGPLITEYANGGKCIVFTQTKRDANSLAYAMGRKSYKCEPLHGDIAQVDRERTLKRFRDGDINILIATDVAARGLDIPNVDLVIHYELPSTSESFVHRSGRTGRAGKKGTAILIHTEDESRSASVIERDVGSKFKELPPVAPDGVELDVFGGFGGGGRSRNSGFSRSGGYGNSSFGGSGGSFGGYGTSGGYGSSGGQGRSGGHGSSGGYGSSGGFGYSGSYGGRFGGSSSSTGGGFIGGSLVSNEKSSFSSTDQSSSFGNFGGSGQSSSGFGNAGSSPFGSFGNKS